MEGEPRCHQSTAVPNSVGEVNCSAICHSSSTPQHHQLWWLPDLIQTIVDAPPPSSSIMDCSVVGAWKLRRLKGSPLQLAEILKCDQVKKTGNIFYLSRIQRKPEAENYTWDSSSDIFHIFYMLHIGALDHLRSTIDQAYQVVFLPVT